MRAASWPSSAASRAEPRAARAISTATPGAGIESFLRITYGLAAAGRTNAHGMPRDPRLLAIALRQVDLLVPHVPASRQAAPLRLLAALARVSGAERDLRPYWQA